MESVTPEAKAFLFELYTLSNGDPDVQVDTQDIAEALGLDKAEAGAMAQDLFIQGFAEMKSLSGGIGITRQGMEALDVALPPEPGGENLSMGSGPVLENQGREAVESLLEEIRSTVSQNQYPFEQVEELVMDLKTIEVQMLSPHPKTAIIREVFKSILDSLEKEGPKDLTGKLERLTAS